MTDGIVLLDKPAGLSSNAALQRVRRRLGARKAGHVGSLDPLATGMLPICLGEATKVAAELIAQRKRYRFVAKLGERTATGDAEGEVVERRPVPELSDDAVKSVLQRFHGPQRQIPPMYSALKSGGQPLYRLARAGIEIERAPRAIEIEALVLIARKSDSLELEAQCSKGTYIRVLAEDIAGALGTCAHVIGLRRLWVEPFQSETMVTLEGIEQGESASLRLLPPDFPLQHLPAVHLDAAASARMAHGQAVQDAAGLAAGRVRLYDARGHFFGIGERDEPGVVRPRRLFASAA